MLSCLKFSISQARKVEAATSSNFVSTRIAGKLKKFLRIYKFESFPSLPLLHFPALKLRVFQYCEFKVKMSKKGSRHPQRKFFGLFLRFLVREARTPEIKKKFKKKLPDVQRKLKSTIFSLL